MLILAQKLIIKILNFKLVILLEFKIYIKKTFLQNTMLQIGLNRFLSLQKLKILYLGHMLLMISTENELLELYMKTNCKKQIKKSLELRK